MKMIEGVRSFFKKQKGEVEKISWPTKKEVISQSILILVVSLLLALLFWGVDLLFNILMGTILK